LGKPEDRLSPENKNRVTKWEKGGGRRDTGEDFETLSRGEENGTKIKRKGKKTSLTSLAQTVPEST